VEAVWLSDLHKQFHHRFELVRSRLCQDAVQRRWFIERPDKVQERWVARGRAVTVGGAALTVLAFWLTHYGLVVIPVLLVGPVLTAGARRMPRRTPVGAELFRRVQGFRAYLQTAGVDGAGSAQAPAQFSSYLPYAMVFGLTEQWTRTLVLVGAPPQTPWYWSHPPYSPARFSFHIGLFSSSAESLTASPPAVSGSSGFSSSGGSSGGGGGGGGGGSW
jgi:uncharacterized membrane protein